MKPEIKVIEKEMSRNDTGETGGHQAGVLIPKRQEILSFFPVLDRGKRNPRINIIFNDHLGDKWVFSFIYYNNRFFGGTRNEYRLTGMTRYINRFGIRSGSTLRLSRDNDENYFVRYKKNEIQKDDTDIIRLSRSWKVIKI